MAFLSENLDQKLSLDAVARVAGLSRYHFLRMFKRETGLPPHLFRTLRRLDRAKQLLCSGTPLAEAALMVGFSDQSHFTNTFRSREREKSMNGSSAERSTISPGQPAVLESDRLLPVAALLAAALLWGGSFSAMRLSVQMIGPWSVMWLCMAIALTMIPPFTGRLTVGTYRKGELVPMVLFQPCLYFLLESHALKFTTSSQAGVISASVPLLVAVGAWLMLAESVGPRTFAGLLLSAAGVAVLSLSGDATVAAANPLLGNALEVAAMASAAVNIIIVKRLCDRYDPWLLTAIQVVAGTLFFAPGLFLLIRHPPTAWTASLILSIAFLAVLVTLGAFGLYNWGLSRVPASQASIFINLVPVTAVAVGWLAMGESLSGMQCIAAAGVIAGVAISQR